MKLCCGSIKCIYWLFVKLHHSLEKLIFILRPFGFSIRARRARSQEIKWLWDYSNNDVMKNWILMKLGEPKNVENIVNWKKEEFLEKMNYSAFANGHRLNLWHYPDMELRLQWFFENSSLMTCNKAELNYTDVDATKSCSLTILSNLSFVKYCGVLKLYCNFWYILKYKKQ